MYAPHTQPISRQMLAAIGVGSLDELLRVPEAVALKGEARRRSGACPNTRSRAASTRFARKNVGGGLPFVPGCGRVPALRAAGDRRAGDARRVSDRVHAVSSRGLARLPAGDLRVADLHLPAHRHGDRQRVGLRRRDGAGRRRDHGAQRDRTPQGSRLACGPSELSRGAADLLRRPRRRDRRDSRSPQTARPISTRCARPVAERRVRGRRAAVAELLR